MKTHKKPKITSSGTVCPYCKALTNHVGPHVYCTKCFARGNYLKQGGYIWKKGTKMTLKQWKEICNKVYTNEKKLYDNQKTLFISNCEMNMFKLGVHQTMEIVREYLFGFVKK